MTRSEKPANPTLDALLELGLITQAELLRFSLEDRIRAHGFEIIYQDICECADTPGFPGHIRGVTDRAKKLVRISRRANPSEDELLDILAHELRHIDEPHWDCGSRDVFGRGGPRP